MNSPPGDTDHRRIDRRREAMRGELLGRMQAHHRRRGRTVRLGAAFSLVLATGLLVLAGTPLFRSANPRLAGDSGELHAPNEPARPIDARRPSVVVHYVSTQSSITDRYTVRTVPAVIQRIDDDSLLDDLVALNRPTGLVRSGDRVWLTSPVSEPLER